MQALSLTLKRLSKSEFNPLFRLTLSSDLYSSSYSSLFKSLPSPPSAASPAPWFIIASRGLRVSGSDVRVGNVIEKQGRIYEVLKVDHSHEGRGKATIKKKMAPKMSRKAMLDIMEKHKQPEGTIAATFGVQKDKGKNIINLTEPSDHNESGFVVKKRCFEEEQFESELALQHRPEKVELRDIGQGNKVTQRMGTDENIERVYVREKTFMYMCTDHDGTVVLMDPDTLDQMEVSRDLFGNNCLYLQAEMKVKVQFYDEKALSASVPKRVTCTVKEGIAATPRNKKVVLDNGLTVEVPPHIVAGDAIVVNTEDDSYIERAKT